MRSVTPYLLATVAGIWMADGVCLLIAPRPLIEKLREVFAQSPSLFRWEVIPMILGLVLIASTQGFRHQPLWTVTGGAMIAKGIFLLASPASWRQPVLDWCLSREEIDYRFWGLGLCTLAILLLHALGWLGQA